MAGSSWSATACRRARRAAVSPYYTPNLQVSLIDERRRLRLTLAYYIDGRPDNESLARASLLAVVTCESALERIERIDPQSLVCCLPLHSLGRSRRRGSWRPTSSGADRVCVWVSGQSVRSECVEPARGVHGPDGWMDACMNTRGRVLSELAPGRAGAGGRAVLISLSMQDWCVRWFTSLAIFTLKLS